ncbi:uncharacterized protein [Narcine bancroftii]
MEAASAPMHIPDHLETLPEEWNPGATSPHVHPRAETARFHCTGIGGMQERHRSTIGQVRNGQEPYLPVGLPVQAPPTLNPGPIRKRPLQARVEGSPRHAPDRHVFAEFQTTPESGKADTATVTPPAAVSPVPRRPDATTGIPPKPAANVPKPETQPTAPSTQVTPPADTSPTEALPAAPNTPGPPLLHLRDQRLRLSHVLRPDRLEFDPRNPGAGTHFSRWQRCFLNYMEGLRHQIKSY